MALVLKDRISETTTTVGTGTLTLAGATPGFQTFSTIGNSNTTYYCIVDGNNWEVGIGTYSSSGDTLARTTILSNYLGTTVAITLSAGTKNVFGVFPADGVVVVNGTTIQVPGNAVLPIANGGTGSNTATFSGANITSINANNISSGVLAVAQGGTGSATATFSGENITSLNASNISTGTLANARTTATSSNGADTIVSRDASGNFSANIITADGSALTGLNATAITAGTISNNRTTASSSNGASTIVQRDASGDFSANIITANGSAITSINASNISTGTLDNARTTASASNGASTIVARDASGNFAGNVVTVGAGSNSAPSLTFSGDTDTGIYSAAGNSVNFAEGAAGYKVGFRNAPPVGTQTGSYSLGVGDVGKYVRLSTGGSVTIPDATFSEGDVVAIFNDTTGNVTITCSITTAYIAGTDADKATMTLATRGVATVLFISGTVCVVSGNVS